MRIAIDAMGGDQAPDEIVAGCLDAARAFDDTEIVCVGDSARLQPLLAGDLPRNFQIQHAPDVIGMEDDPARAVQRKPDSSLAVGFKMVREGEAQAVFSAGNSGAVAAAALLLLGRIPGVRRPCIMTIFPSRLGRTVIADVGASIDCDPAWIVQFAIMAQMYARECEGLATPRVGLLNIGEEACKGNAQAKEAHERLASLAGSEFNWVGNVEAKDIFAGKVDVVATDGFGGNILLKTAEATVEFYTALIREELTSSLPRKVLGLAVKRVLKGLKSRVDYAEYGGAFLMGVRGLVLIGHGRSDRRAVVSAVRRAREGVSHDLVARLEQRFSADEAAVA